MIRRSYLDGCWRQVHLRRCGAGTPLLLLHQSQLSGAMFDPAMAHLAAAGIEAVALDTAGFALSDGPPGSVSIPEYADALAELIGTHFDQPVNLLGHHTGIAANLAARHPGKVGWLLLNGVPWPASGELSHFRGFRFGPLEHVADGSHLLAAWNQRLTASPGWTNLNALHWHVVEMPRVNRTYYWGFQAAFAHDHEPDLRAIACPTLILTNTGENLFEPSRRAAALRPDFEFAALDGGTHDIVDEQPAAWASRVGCFKRSDGYLP